MPDDAAGAWLCRLVGPGHVAALPGDRKSLPGGFRFSQPRAAARQQLQVIRQLLQLGERVAVLPPAPLPDTGQLQMAAAEALDSPQLYASEPLLAQRACHDGDACLADWLSIFAPEDCGDQRWHLQIASGGAQPWQLAGAWRRLATLQAHCAQAVLHPALPPLPGWLSVGAATHLRLNSGSAPALQLFAAQRHSGLEASALPRRQPVHSDREAQQAWIRSAGLRPGRSLLVRQHWSGPDAGCWYLRDAVCSGAGLLVLHPRALAEQHRILAELPQLLPGIQVSVLPERLCPLADLLPRSVLGGLLGGAPGRPWLLQPVSALRPGQGRYWHDMQAKGYLQRLEACTWDHRLFGGGLGRVFLQLPASHQPPPIAASLWADASTVQRWQEWSEQLPDEILPSDFGSPRHLTACRQAAERWPTT